MYKTEEIKDRHQPYMKRLKFYAYLEDKGIELTDSEKRDYAIIVNYFNKLNIVIPFPVRNVPKIKKVALSIAIRKKI